MIGDGTAIFATFPIWTVILAAIFLKERIMFVHIIAMILGIVGVILITQPPMFFTRLDAEQYSFQGKSIYSNRRTAFESIP